MLAIKNVIARGTLWQPPMDAQNDIKDRLSNRRMFLIGAFATATTLAMVPGPAFASSTDRVANSEREYRAAMQSGDARRIALARHDLAATYRHMSFGRGVEQRRKALSLYEEAFSPKVDKMFREGGALARTMWAEMLLEDDRATTQSNLKLIRKRLGEAKRYTKPGSLGLTLAISGMHAALLAGDLSEADKWFRFGLASVAVSDTIKGRYSDTKVKRLNGTFKELADFYRLAAQFAFEKKDIELVVRWMEAGNNYSQSALGKADILKVPDTSNSRRDTAFLAEQVEGVVHLLVSRAGSGIVVTQRKGSKVNWSLWNCKGLTAKQFDQKDLEILLWGDLGWRAKARGRFSGWHGAYNATRTATFITSVPIAGQNLWNCVGSSIRNALRDHGISKNASFFMIGPPELGVMPLQIANDGAEYPFVDDLLIPMYGPYSAALRQAVERVKSKEQPKLLGLFNPTRDLPTAFAEKIIVENSFAKSNRYQISAGVDGNSLLRLMSETDNHWIYISSHGAFTGKNGSIVLLGGRQAISTQLVRNYRGQLKSRLVIMSACETANTNYIPSAEPTSLPSALLDKGVSGVIGTRWSVNDFSTTVMMGAFAMLQQASNTLPAVMLGMAQKWMRISQASTLAAFYREEAKKCVPADAQKLEVMAKYYERMPADSRPYENPYYWAGFSFFGA